MHIEETTMRAGGKATKNDKKKRRKRVGGTRQIGQWNSLGHALALMLPQQIKEKKTFAPSSLAVGCSRILRNIRQM